MELYIGHEPAVVERLQNILRNARDIKRVIQKVGQTMAPAQAQPTGFEEEVKSDSWRAGGSWLSTPTRACGAPRTSSWTATGAWWRRRTTATRPDSWCGTSAPGPATT